MDNEKEKILVVEDEQDILELLTFNLTREGYEVTGISNGEQALRDIPRLQPHLVLLDLMLPDVDGLEICRILRSSQATAKIPIIMITAKGEPSDVVLGLQTGADDYLAKPFDKKVLLARIHALLRRSKQPASLPTDAAEPQDIVINSLRQIESDLLKNMFSRK